MTGRSHNYMSVAGESFYQDALRPLSEGLLLLGREDRHFEAVLVPEPDNQHDSNAVAVKMPDGGTIGYLPRETAKSFHRIIAAQPAPVTCPAQLCGGEPDRPSIGVVLDFSHIHALRDGVIARKRAKPSRSADRPRPTPPLTPQLQSTKPRDWAAVIGRALAALAVFALIYGLFIVWPQ